MLRLELVVGSSTVGMPSLPYAAPASDIVDLKVDRKVDRSRWQHSPMHIAIGSDHAGFELKTHLIGVLRADGHLVDDHGTDSIEPVDYPPICAGVGRAVASDEVDAASSLGGSGQGEQISANKVEGVRAALCNDLFTAELLTSAQRRQRVVDRRPRRRHRPRRGDRVGVALDLVRGWSAPTARRPDHRDRPSPLSRLPPDPVL